MTDATKGQREGMGRVAVPIVDADAHATFYLFALTDASQRVQEIFRWVDSKRGA